MTIQLKLTKEQIEDLSIIRDLGAETIQKIIDKFSNLAPPPIHPSDLLPALNDILPGDLDKMDKIFNQLMYFCIFRRQRNLNEQDLLKGLLNAITTGKPRWSKEEVSQWQKLEPQLQELFSLKNIWTVVKALDLSFDYNNLLQKIKILTDIRPVFNEDASDIRGSVISYTLRLYYDSLEGSKSLSISLDKDDIEQLLELCERALKKSETAKNFMQKSDIKATYICGEEKDR